MSDIIAEIQRDTTTLLGKTLESLVSLVEQGYSFRAACAEAGVSYYTFNEWMMKGGDPGSISRHKCPPHVRVEPYYSFARTMRQAEKVGKAVERPRPPIGPKPAGISDAQRALVMDGFRQGWTLRAIARHADIRYSTLCGWLHRGGYPRLTTGHIPIAPAHIADPYKSFVAEVGAAEDAFFTDEW